MGRILVIPNSDFSRNCIEKVNITKQVENCRSLTPNSSTVSVNNNSSLKNNVQ